MKSLQEIDETLEQLARDHLRVPTLHPRGRDDLDFYDLSVWIIRDGLRAAYMAGMDREAAMRVQRMPFAQYWKAVDTVMEETFGIDTGDAGIEPGELACARTVGITPEDFVLTFGEKYGLTPLSEFRANWGRP